MMITTRVGQKEIAVLFTAFIGAVYGFGMYLFPAIVESIRKDINFSYSTMGLISGAVQAGFFVSAALAGFLTLWFGAINLILFSIILSALALGGLAPGRQRLHVGRAAVDPGGLRIADLGAHGRGVTRNHIPQQSRQGLGLDVFGHQLWGFHQ